MPRWFGDVSGWRRAGTVVADDMSRADVRGASAAERRSICWRWANCDTRCSQALRTSAMSARLLVVGRQLSQRAESVRLIGVLVAADKQP